ncbi:UDP-glucuronosyltransferase 2C1-like isoform X2 [Syngnathoides biaculeatus]|uniref:UDP-glucuronosyltransferase 2C1-like isoform X2 n=1 Tax=Syngnathoides biaculeatus TaxID=300417 RepID=UPI002ADE0F83|nr:UDP-glucuronosyltransferase 2C1-like isoform X2 [Syngnathoides biaculeatus]
MMLPCCSIASLLLIFLPHACQGGNILVFPGEGSHWVNMNILMRELHSHGHNLTIVRPSKAWYVKEDASYYDTITVPVERSLDKDFITGLIDEAIENERGSQPLVSFLHMSVGMVGIFLEAHKTVAEFATAILDNQDLTRRLKDSKFDLVLTDPCWGSGIIVAKYLNLPLVYNVRWVITTEGHMAIAPSPLSYIPITGTGNSNKMTFFQRFKNMIVFLIGYVQHNLVINNIYQKVCDKYLGPDTNMHHLLLSADIWLMRADFVFEFPRPTMPNVIYMGGFQCKPAKPLPDQLEEFVESSGEHGVIFMSLGTFVSKLSADLADKIAAAFAKLPQKVIWRYKGAKPSTLGNNTLLVDWVPQNDLLGHPKMKLFVAHGGTNGVQEAIYHGVPVVGIPLFFDQHDNLLRLTERGAAVVVTLALVDKDDNFLKAIQEVLVNPVYRNNMQRLSRLHRDLPMPPLDNALFWIGFVIRHKGAAHLQTESYKLPWYTYYSVDVYLFLAGAVLALILTVVIGIRCLCSVLWRTKVKRSGAAGAVVQLTRLKTVEMILRHSCPSRCPTPLCQPSRPLGPSTSWPPSFPTISLRSHT